MKRFEINYQVTVKLRRLNGNHQNVIWHADQERDYSNSDGMNNVTRWEALTRLGMIRRSERVRYPNAKRRRT